TGPAGGGLRLVADALPFASSADTNRPSVIAYIRPSDGDMAVDVVVTFPESCFAASASPALPQTGTSPSDLVVAGAVVVGVGAVALAGAAGGQAPWWRRRRRTLA
ncbi:MAG TPA: hypothetical protein DCR14_16315, partial [Acidimicrobiaceae bacterium]|nr:hypothetical protein [Acidimicrobiaceae bacterium]